MLTLEAVTHIKAELESAFKPLQCRVQVYNSGERLRFKVFDEDYAIACEMGDLSLKVSESKKTNSESSRFRTDQCRFVSF